MTSQIDTAKHVYRSLAEECELAMALVDVLLEEQACLVKLQTPELNSLALRKEAMMLELEKRYLDNIQQAKAAGFQPTMDGLALWTDVLAMHEPRLLGTYSTLRSTLSHARRLNKTNGELVAEQLAGLQERISILTAAAVADQKPAASDTYGPKGGMSQSALTGGITPRAVIR
ncbi:MAG TPA: flagellar protein FlgN [Limnobacter sp.]|nr:flagellar protein FlgN [Limnobacter sp.]